MADKIASAPIHENDLRDSLSLAKIGILASSKQWALTVNEGLAYLVRTSGDMAIERNDPVKISEVKEASYLAAKTFKEIADVEAPELKSDDMRVSAEAGSVAEKLAKRISSSDASLQTETAKRFSDAINTFNSKRDYGFSVNALALRFVELCGEMSEGKPVQKVSWVCAVADFISLSFQAIDEPGKELRKDNIVTAKKIDDRVALIEDSLPKMPSKRK
jgi:hypothetical protein